MANWKSNCNPQELLEIIENSKKIKANGSIEFSNLSFKLYDALLYSMLQLSNEIPEIDGRKISYQSIFNTGAKGKIIPSRFIAEVSKLESKYLTQPYIRYVLTTSISIDRMSQIDRQYIGRTQIIFEPFLSKRFSKELDELQKAAKNDLFTEAPKNYIAVRVHVSAKSHAQAAEIALDSLDLIRGIWNLYENRRLPYRYSFGGKPKPVNKYILGPFHFLHYPSGKLAEDSMWWYEKSYISPINPTKIGDKEKLDKYYLQIRKSLDKSHYKNDIEQAIIRYSRSLDERNWENAFIKLWGILELLTDSINESQKQTIKKAAFFYKDFSLAQQILEQLTRL